MKRALQSFLIVLLCLVLLIAGILASVELWMPSAVRKFSPDYISGAQLDISELTIKWCKADIELRGVQLRKDGKTQASIAGIAVDLRSQGLLSGLLDQTLIVDRISIDNAKLTVAENQGQWGLRGLSLANANNTEQNESPSADSEAKNESKRWQVIINDARLEDITVSVRSEQLDSDLTIKSLTLDHFDSLADTLKSEIALTLNIDKTTAAINPTYKILLAGGSNIDLKLAATGPLATPNLKGQLQLDNIAASLQQSKDNSEQALLSLGKMKLDNFNSAFLSKANSQVQELLIQDLVLLPGHDQGQTLDTLNIAIIEHHPGGDNASLNVQGIHINGLHSQLAFLKGYKLGVQEELNRFLTSIFPVENTPTPTQSVSNKDAVKAKGKNGESIEESKSALTIALEDIQLLNSNIHIRDDNYKPAVTIPIAIDRFVVNQFNSGDRDSLSRWVLSANVDKQGLLNSEGVIKPLAENMVLQAKLRLEHIKLVTFSPYIEKQTGYFIHTGQLSLDSQGQLSGKQLQSKNQIDLRSIELEKVSADKADQVDQSISMPLDFALGLLRDDNGDVRLELPVNGNIDSPEFGSGDMLKQVISHALLEASVSYLKYAFQPYGTLISVGSWLNDQAQKIRLDSLAFDNGQIELSEQQQVYLQKLGQLLQKKAQLRVRACPVISVSEERWTETQKALQPQAQAQAQAQAQNREAETSEQAPNPDFTDIKDANQLAEARTESLRSFMKARFDIGPERLLTCKTQTDEKSTKSYIHLEI